MNITKIFFEKNFYAKFFDCLNADITSSDINKFLALETPELNEENKIHLILKLLSPETDIFFLKGLILFRITKVLAIQLN